MKKLGIILVVFAAMCLAGCSNGSSPVEPHEHTFNNEVWEYDSTYHWHPSTCGHDVTSTKTPHSFVDEVVEPTYQTKGYTVHICSVCNYSYKDNETSHEHKPGNPVQENRVEPTCTEDGSYDLVVYCTDDNVEISREHKTIPALGHDLVYHDGRAATCTVDGWAAYETCNRCDYTTYKVIPATGHQHLSTREENRVEPNCVDDGSYDLVTYCTDDNVEISREHKTIPALGHILTHHEGRAATCTEDGWEEYDTCSRCGYSNKVIIPATGHQHLSTREENRVEPNCVNNGSYDLVTYCTDDGAEISREQKIIPALGHDLIHHDGSVPTCTEDGWEEYDTCSRCGYSNKVIIPATGHQHLSTREENRVNPTCTSDGSYDLVTYCTDDNAEISREKQTIPALGHNLIHHSAKEPTCTSIGWNEYDTCSRCDYTTYQEISPTGHQHLSTREENRVAPTCTTSGGYDIVTYCTDDDFEISREHYSISALGHNYIGVETEPTFEQDGYWTYTCSRCGDSYTQKGKDKIPHNYSDEWSYDSANHWHYCVDAGYENEKANISSHSYNKTVTPPTGLAEGYTTYTCKVCGYSYVGDIVDKLTYTIIWKNWDGTVLETDSNLAYNSIPHYDGATPTKDDDSSNAYSFSGWFPEIAPVTDNIVYTAQFDAYKHYLISYELNGGINSVNNPSYYTGLSGTITLEEPSKTGYTFIGWTGSNGDTPEKNVSFSGSNLMDRNYTANWELAIYDITYVLYGGTNSPKNPSQITIVDTVELKDASKTGYTFKGWYLDDEFKNKITSLSKIASDTTIYARFVPNQYTVTFKDKVRLTLICDGVTTKLDLENGEVIDLSSPDIINAAAGKTIVSSSSLGLKNNSVFMYWYNQETGQKVTKLTIKKNTTLCAKIEKNYQGNSLIGSYVALSDKMSVGTIDSQQKYTYRYHNSNMSSSYFRVPDFINGKMRVYYSLDTRNNEYMLDVKRSTGTDFPYDSSFTYYTDGEKYTISNKSVVPEYGKYQYVSGVSNGSTFYNFAYFDIKCSAGQFIYIYIHCTNDSGYSSKQSYELVFAADRTSWDLTSNATTSVAVNFDEGFDTPENNPFAGYTFDGWYDDNGEKINNESWEYDEDRTYHSVYHPTAYDISYELNGGKNSLANPTTYTVEDTIVLSNASKAGYTFKGWYLDKNFSQKIETISGMTGALTLYAKFEVNTYTGTLDLDGGTLSPQVTYISDGSVLASSFLTGNDSVISYYPPEKDGYIFGGWYLDEGFTQVFNYSGQITKDLTLYAKWIETDLMKHQITSNSVETESISINGLTENKITFVPIASGYLTITTVSDLDLKGILYDQSNNAVMEADDISDENFNFSMRFYVEAGHQYTIGIKGATSLIKGDCDVQFLFEGNLGISGITYDAYSIDVVYGNSFTLLTPTKEGYEFLGWFDKDGNPIDFNNWSYSSDITIYAHWRLI